MGYVGRFRLALIPLVAACIIALVALVASHAEAGTVYLDNLVVDETTILRDGTWVVNGSVFVENGTLVLENATLHLRNDQLVPELLVGTSGSLVASDSRIDFDGAHTSVLIQNDTRFERCELVWQGGEVGGGPRILHEHGNLTIDRCWVDNGAQTEVLLSESNLTIKDSVFQNGQWYRCIVWEPTTQPTGGTTYGWPELLVAGVGFRQAPPIPEVQPAGAIVLAGADTAGHGQGPSATIRECRISWSMGIDIGDDGAPVEYPVLVENCTGTNLTRGVLVRGTSAVELRNNTWAMERTGVAMNVSLWTYSAPRISGGAVTGGFAGLWVTSTSSGLALTVQEVVFENCLRAVVAVGTEVDLLGCNVSSSSIGVTTLDGAWVHLMDCEYSKTRVDAHSGEVAELVEVRITGAVWQNGRPLLWGVLQFEPYRDYRESRFDVEHPATAWLPVWILGPTAETNVTWTRGRLMDGGQAFLSRPFVIPTPIGVYLTFTDEVAPRAQVDLPARGSYVNTSEIHLEGTVTDLGSGIYKLSVSPDSGATWTIADIREGGSWYATLYDLPDGPLRLKLCAIDRAGTYGWYDYGGITVDTVAPTVTPCAFPPWSRFTPVHVTFATDPGCSAFVRGVEVTVDAEGVFRGTIDLVAGDNIVEVVVIDRAGNVGRWTGTMGLDTEPPHVAILEPRDGVWFATDTVRVTGAAEPGAEVRVNGRLALNSEGAFTIVVTLSSGLASIRAVARDEAGNTDEDEVNVNIDMTPPVVIIESLDEVQVTDDPYALLLGLVIEDNLASMWCSHGNVTVEGDQWEVRPALAEGRNDVQVVAEDRAGSRGEVTFLVILDTMPPVVEAVLNVSGDLYAPDGEPLVCGAGTVELLVRTDENCTVTVRGTGYEAVGGVPFDIALRLVDGENLIEIDARDRFMHSCPRLTFVVVRDVVAPDLTVSSPATGSWSMSERVTFRIVTEPWAFVTVGGSEGTAGANGVFTTEVMLAEGVNDITVTARDAFGNEANRTVRVRYDPSEDGGDGGSSHMDLPPSAVPAAVMALILLLLLLVRRSKRLRRVTPATEVRRARERVVPRGVRPEDESPSGQSYEGQPPNGEVTGREP